MTLPVEAASGSRRTVYVLVLGSVTGSRNPSIEANAASDESVEPSGRRIDTRVVQQLPEILTAARCPAVPWKVTRAFCPGTVVVNVFVEPNAIVSARSAGTSWSETVALPVVAP